MKIAKICLNLSTPDLNMLSTTISKQPEPQPNYNLSSFQSTTPYALSKLISNSPIKSCSLDSLPTTLFKTAFPHLLNVIISIINMTLCSEVVTKSFNEAQLTPILKTPHLDKDLLNYNYPV